MEADYYVGAVHTVCEWAEVTFWSCDVIGGTRADPHCFMGMCGLGHGHVEHGTYGP